MSWTPGSSPEGNLGQTFTDRQVHKHPVVRSRFNTFISFLCRFCKAYAKLCLFLPNNSAAIPTAPVEVGTTWVIWCCSFPAWESVSDTWFSAKRLLSHWLTSLLNPTRIAEVSFMNCPSSYEKIKSCIRRGWPHVTGPFVWKTLVTVSFVHVDVFTNFRGAQAKYWHWEEHNSHLFLVKFGKVKAHGSWGHGLIK